jgi:ABC-type nitrate/sulfonate/bicarbonate transport system substrate-binding protein
LEAGQIDGFWANAMGAETAVSRGVGKVLVDVRRGDDPGEVRRFTFAGMVTSDSFTENNPAAVAAAVRAIVKAQKALKADPRLAAEVGRRKFPKEAADLIGKVVERDVVFYDPAILPEEVEAMNRFAQAVGHLSDPVAYDDVVATRFRDLWK